MTFEKIYLLPMGFQDDRLFDEISIALENKFLIPIDRLLPVPVPERTYNNERDQYHSTMILMGLREFIPKDAIRLLAVTNVDIYVPQMNYIFGEATVDGWTCIISLHRLLPEFYGEPPNHELFTERAVKEAIHELGHTFGLRHCGDPNCIMYFSTTIQDTDRKSADFCGECAMQLASRMRTLKAAA